LVWQIIGVVLEKLTSKGIAVLSAVGSSECDKAMRMFLWLGGADGGDRVDIFVFEPFYYVINAAHEPKI
jgi:hypothetical protein